MIKKKKNLMLNEEFYSRFFLALNQIKFLKRMY